MSTEQADTEACALREALSKWARGDRLNADEINLLGTYSEKYLSILDGSMVETDLRFCVGPYPEDNALGRPTCVYIKDDKPTLWPLPDDDYEIVVRKRVSAWEKQNNG